jgi:hypothetical protein
VNVRAKERRPCGALLAFLAALIIIGGKIEALMKTIDITKSIYIQAEPTAFYAHLSDIGNHPGLQPLVIETREIGREIDEAGHTIIHFYSVEALRLLGFIPYHNKIRVKMIQIPEENLIIHEVESFPNIQLVSRTLFQADAGGTAVTETLHITTPNLVANYVQKTAVAAHETLMHNLKARLESSQGS